MSETAVPLSIRPEPGTLEIWYEEDDEEWIEVPYYQFRPRQQPGGYQ